MTMWNDYEKIARRVDRIAKAFERIANALETANIIAADRNTEPRGEWIEGKYDLMCSNCENTQEYEKFPYCPYCGAKMADRKTEPIDKDINVRSKTEPQTDMAEDIVESFGFKAESYRQAKAKDEPQTDCSWR